MRTALTRFGPLLLAALVAFGGLSASPAAAVLIADERFVDSYSETCPPVGSGCVLDWDEHEEPASPFAAFNGNVQNVTQDSTVAPLLFVASGQAWHFEDPEDDTFNDDESRFSIVFGVAQATTFDITFSYAQAANVTLQNLGTDDFVYLGPQDFDGYGWSGAHQGVLDAGTYRILAHAWHGDVSQDPGQYALTLALPEPGAGALAMLAAAAGLRARSRLRPAPLDSTGEGA